MDEAQPPSADVITTFADLHDRVVRQLHACGLALATLVREARVLDGSIAETLSAVQATLDLAVRDIHATTFAVRQQLRPQAAADSDGHRRYVIRIEDEAVLAYADGDGHDFRRVHDDSIWAHESDGTLLSARSGTPIARRSGIVYYDAVNDIPLYYLTR